MSQNLKLTAFRIIKDFVRAAVCLAIGGGLAYLALYTEAVVRAPDVRPITNMERLK